MREDFEYLAIVNSFGGRYGFNFDRLKSRGEDGYVNSKPGFLRLREDSVEVGVALTHSYTNRSSRHQRRRQSFKHVDSEETEYCHSNSPTRAQSIKQSTIPSFSPQVDHPRRGLDQRGTEHAVLTTGIRYAEDFQDYVDHHSWKGTE